MAMAARYQSEEPESPEHRILRVNLVAICDGISDIVGFSEELVENGLINFASYHGVFQSSLPPASMVAILVSDVMDKVNNSPTNFHKFVSILMSSNQDLALTLMRTYHRNRRLRHEFEPESDSFMPVSEPLLFQAERSHSEAFPSLADKTKRQPRGWITVKQENLLIEPSPVPEPLSFQAKRSRSLADREKFRFHSWLFRKCKVISSTNSPPTIYQLPLRYTLKGEMVATAVVGRRTFFSRRSQHLILMLVGATGAGKSTLINGMANYIMGVDWEDHYRFKLISEEETEHDQSKSQTKCVTAYTFHKPEDLPFPYTLTVIDTPGLGGTEGLQRDKEIVAHIKELFSLRGIDKLHGIGFVTQAPLARLTQTKRYVFDSILSVFGKDVADNIFLMTTFADGMRPAVLDAARAAGVPFSNHFKFNNSAVFASNQAGDEFDAMFWKMGVESFRQFFDEFSEAESTSLQQSREVLEERERLELAIQALQPQIRARIGKMAELQQERQLLRKHECVIHDTKDFTFQVIVTKKGTTDIPPGQYTTTCIKCSHTCHYPCPFPSADDKYKCRTMNNRGSLDATCRVCPGKCSWEDHTNFPCKIEIYQETETRISEELKAMYVSAMTNKQQVESKMKEIEEELKEINTAIVQEIDQSKRSSRRLQEIAIKPDPLTELEYIDVLIRSEKQEARPGWGQRVKALEGARKQAEILSIFLECDKHDLSEDFWSRLKL